MGSGLVVVLLILSTTPLWEQGHVMRYRGHINQQTIKDVAFVGPDDSTIAAGSDCGRMFLWDRASGGYHHLCVPSIYSTCRDKIAGFSREGRWIPAHAHSH